MAHLKHPSTDNWCVVVEFASYEDAVAFRQLIDGLNPISVATRPKNQHPSNGNVATWRLTVALREQLSGRSFTREDCQIAAQLSGYATSTAIGWLASAKAVGLIQRLEVGVYEFLPEAQSAAISETAPCQAP